MASGTRRQHVYSNPLSIAPPCAESPPRSKHQRISRKIYKFSTVAHSRQMQSSSSTSTAAVSAIFGRLFADESAGLAEVGVAAASAAASAAHAINSNYGEPRKFSPEEKSTCSALLDELFTSTF